MNKCSSTFETKYAVVKESKIHIDDYISGNFRDARCINKHELIPVKGEKIRSHFRHKNSGDTENGGMCDWHYDWQSNFTETEVSFKNGFGQIRPRRADVVVSNLRRIVEIQNSSIKREDVYERINDYKIHGYSVIWVIHSQNSIHIKKIGERLVLHFSSKPWLYESFLDCGVAYYDIDGFIYKVEPSNVRSNQIDVCQPKLKSDFIESLKSQNPLWINETIPQCYLYVRQQGAGSGKTYGMMQLLNKDIEFACFKTIIFITKQHAAVNVMYTEFMNQYITGALSNIELTGEPSFENRKHVVSYMHKLSGIETNVIFATVDSFTCVVGGDPKNSSDQFIGKVKSIIEGATKLTRSGALNYAGVNVHVNKESIIMIDETQDLTELYGEAFLKLVLSNSTNLCVVGDRLQSLVFRNNALTLLHRAEDSGMKVVNEDESNVVRRFSDKQLVSLVNSVVPFEKYDLPGMTSANITETQDALTVFSGKTVYANESTESENVVESVTQIIDYYRKEVEKNGRIPEDFLVVTPFTATNPLVQALQLAITSYWKETMEDPEYINNVKSKNEYWKDINTDEYNRYAVFHKSQEMGSINLDDSKHATRMVSIHSSKGDGRKVVFVIGVTQSALQLFSGVANNLIYDSLLHVAITRQKERLYFRLERNGDDIYQRISRSNVDITSSNADFDFDRGSLTLQRISKYALDSCYDNLYKNIISKNQISALPKLSDEKLLIDMGDHNMRYASMLLNVIIHTCNHEYQTASSTKRQFHAILGKVGRVKIETVEKWNKYIDILVSNHDNKKQQCIPLLKISSKGVDTCYNHYYTVIHQTMVNIQKKLRFLGTSEINYFCPLESVILYYMVESVENGRYQSITINDVYNIVDTYSSVWDSSSLGHETCKCKTHFSPTTGKLSESQIKTQQYLRNHYNRLEHVCSILDNFVSKHPQVNWLYSHPICYYNKNNITDFSILKQFNLVGYDDKTVYVFNLKPQFSEINFNEFVVDTIYDSWIISNSTDNKFCGKKVTSYVLSLDRTELYILDWNNIVIENIDYIADTVFDTMYKNYSNKHEQYYNTFRTLIEEFDSAKKVIEYCKKSAGKEKVAKYISDFWTFIEGLVGNAFGKEEKIAVLNQFTEKEKFITTINGFLERSLSRYFNREEDDE